MPHVSTASLAAILGILALAALCYRSQALFGTTLMAPWIWALFAVAMVTSSEVVAAMAYPPRAVAGDWVAPVKFICYAATLCPAMALLGAKRPQNRAWKFIVLSMWCVLSLPALVNLLFPRGRFYVEPLWSWFLLVLIATGILNYLPTRNWLAALLCGGGQIALLYPYLPRLPIVHQLFANGTASADQELGWPLTGLLLLGCAALTVQITARCGRSSADCSRMPMDRMWRDFRNSFGALWGLRVAERVNAVSARHNWPVRLRWDGFQIKTGDAAAEANASEELADVTQQAVTRILRNLLRRFVSARWIDQRLRGS